MIRWSPDTCYCIIICEAPSKQGEFEKRCRIHQTTRDTTEVYDHNLANRLKTTEIIKTPRVGTPDRPNPPDIEEPTPPAIQRKRILRESTKP